MRIARFAAAALAAALVLPGAAGAVTFGGTYTVDAHDSGPGLLVAVDPGAGSFATPDLDVGGSARFDVFAIWTNESTVNAGEDTALKPISVSFNFTSPFLGGGVVTGDTFGARVFAGFIQQGRVVWDGPLTLSFGAGGSGKVSLTLTDAMFSFGLFGTTPGASRSATVGATLSYDVAPVPLPATLPLLLGGLGLAGAVAWRRRTAAAA